MAEKKSVGDLAVEALKKGMSNEDALAYVKRKRLDCNVSLASINWYRNALRRENSRVPTARALRAKARKAKEKKAKKR